MKNSPLAGPALRVAIALALSAACFQAGRWYEELSIRADPGNELVYATFRPAPVTVVTAPGKLLGESGDIITPLNVRDPSALVMGPAFRECAPARPIAEPRSKAIDPSKLDSGRLLELLREADKKRPRDF